MTQKAGVEIYKRFYPFAEDFRPLSDPILVREVTGMEWPQFLRAIEVMEFSEVVDQVALAGMIAVAFWQQNSEMSREQVRRTLEKVKAEDIEIIGGDDVEEGTSPPAEDGVKPSALQRNSNGSQVDESGGMSPSDSGSLGSRTGSPESSPA